MLAFFALVSTSAYSLRILTILVGCYRSYRMKLLGIENFRNILKYLRLVLLSVFGGFMLFFFYSPVVESGSLRGLKYMPNIFIVVRLVVSWILLTVAYSTRYYFTNYLLYFNPLFHKGLGIILFVFNKVYLYIDLLVLEYILPRGLSGFFVKNKKTRWVLFLGLLVFIFCWAY